MSGPKLSEDGERAVNAYLWRLGGRLAAVIGIVNVLALWGAYNVVVDRAAEGAEQAAVNRVNELQEPFKNMVSTLTTSSVEALDKIGDAQEQVDALTGEFEGLWETADNLTSEFEELSEVLTRIETEVASRSQRALETIELHIGLVERPTITVLEPRLQSGLLVVPPGATSIRLVARVFHPSPVLELRALDQLMTAAGTDGAYAIDIPVAANMSRIPLRVKTESGHTNVIEVRLQHADQAPASKPPGMIVARRAGCTGEGPACDNVWSAADKKDLTYCIATDFGENYAIVKTAFAASFARWEAAADVTFRHVEALDDQCNENQDGVLFDVRPIMANGRYLVSSFFPGDPRARRSLLVESSAFKLTGDISLTGIATHEIGHVLGFRHEHTRPEAGACFEDDNWRALGPYNSNSVMHFPQCNGTNDWKFELTETDKNGVACIYGASAGRPIDPTICASN